MSTTADTSRADPISIRSAHPDDAEQIFGMLRRLDPTYAPSRSDFDAAYRFLTEESPSSVFLACVNSTGDVIGYALTTITPLLHMNDSSAQLQELVVDDASQGAGVGTALVEALEAICRDRGVSQLTVASRRSADFYERLGYHSTADFLKRTFD